MRRQNKNIKGIQDNDTENKISQYADDTELLLEGDRNSFEEAVLTIDHSTARRKLRPFLDVWQATRCMRIRNTLDLLPD